MFEDSVAIHVYSANIVLSYLTVDTLQTWVRDVPTDIYDNPNDYTVQLTTRQVSGTPYGQVTKGLVYDIRTSTQQFVVNAYGSSFVSGNTLTVSLDILKHI